uniref:Mitochondrial Rho GTPase 1 n=1 Tax=Ascaris lumbricoides TaxID=6252 RepID=A0A0M3HX59_ASCLU
MQVALHVKSCISCELKFQLCDFDNDGLLNDHELNQFQVFVFGVPLNAVAISDVKTAVEEHRKDDIIDNAVALGGFLYLHELFIRRGRHETAWKVLRRFGYDNELQLAVDYLSTPLVSQPSCEVLCAAFSLKVPKGCSTELTDEGLRFITALFEKYDEDRDGCLSPSELQNLFSVCSTNPWTKEASCSVEVNTKGWLTFNGYMSYWILTTFMNVSLTMELLAYLGFNMRHHSQLDAIRVTRDRRLDLLEKRTTRSVFQCHVIGPRNAGKTAFIQSFLGRTLADILSISKKHLSPYVINSVTVKGEVKYLLLHEVDVCSRDEVLTSYEKSADVIVLLYDASNPNSFSYSASIYLRYFYRTKVPCVIIATKVERYEAEQNYEQQPSEFCRTHELPQPIRFREEDIGNVQSDVFTQLATMAVYPHLKRVYFLQDSNLLSKITFGAAVAALAGFLLYKNI